AEAASAPRRRFHAAAARHPPSSRLPDSIEALQSEVALASVAGGCRPGKPGANRDAVRIRQQVEPRGLPGKKAAPAVEQHAVEEVRHTGGLLLVAGVVREVPGLDQVPEPTCAARR